MKKYIVFDIETTCWENDTKEARELIEIGACALDSNFSIIDSFEKFCKPLINPVLTEFCINLTGITQEMINSADNFKIVLPEFAKWINSFEDAELISWGNYDKTHLLFENERTGLNNLDFIKTTEKHTNLKREFEIKYKLQNCEIQAALNMLGKEFDGSLHRGIDDAKNIVRILKEIR